MYDPAKAFFVPKVHPAQRTFPIFGHYRGGTSMVAGLLRQMGLYLGERVDPGNNEDPDFRDAPRAKLIEMIHRRNAEHDVWGWKDPGLYRTIGQDFGLLRNPFSIVILRDVFACAQAELWRGQTNDVFTTLRRKQDEQSKMISFMDRIYAARRPMLVISYDRTIVNPERAVDQLIAFTGLSVDEATRQRATAFVQPERGNGDPTIEPTPREVLSRGVAASEAIAV